MKKILTLICTLLCANVLMAQTRFTIGDLTYKVTSITTVEVSDCVENATSVTIPSTVTYSEISLEVTSIGSSAFYNCDGLTSITIPNSVTSIGDSAFYYCSSLTSVTIPNSVTSIGNYAFRSCSSLTSITIPNGVTSIGYRMFYGCSSLTSVTIGNSVTSIGQEAFKNCSSLTSIDIPNSVTSIGYSAFENCSSLTSIDIPNSVTSIGYSAFENCSSLTSVTIPNSVTSIGSSAFYNCDGLTSITIPNSVTSIGGYTFYSCSSLTSVTIGNSVTSIGDYEFAYCSSLTSVTIGNSVTSIGNDAFKNCTSLTTLNFNAINCNSFSSYKHPFINCPITTINIGDSVQIIPAYFAYNLDALTSVTIGNSVTSIGNGAFGNCSSLTSITIPNSVTSIGNSAFYGCNGLSILNFNAINCGDFTTSNYPFADCPFIVINIGDSVERIPDYFAFDKNLLTSISVPNSVTEIGNNAFDSCSALTSVILGDGLSTLPANAFANCNDILYITLGSGFASLPANAFSHCLLLQGVTSNAVVPPLCSSTVFPYPNTATLTVPCGSLEAYSAQTSIWSILFADRIEEDGYEVVANVNNDAFGSVAIENNCSTATLTATANDCYQFVGWNDGNTENPRLVTLSSDTTLTANFEVMVVNNDITATICEGQVYTENNFNVSEAGVYTQTLTSVNGCDSIVTLTLNVNPIFNTELTATICEGQVYTENNFNISEAGVYTQTLTSVNGCDSIVTLTLNILPSYNTNLTATICQGSELNISGFHVTEGGVYTQNLTSVNGCDSIVTLTVTELPIIHTDLTLTICEGTSLNFSGFNVSEAGVYTQNLTSVNGCDSIVTLTVSVNPTFDTTINATINAGETYTEFGFNESEAGTYVQNLQTEFGCDSTITLVLSVNSSLLEAEIEEISFYPNPTKDKITFSQAIENVEVIDLTGKVIFTFTNVKTINIESLPSGAYYLRLTNNEKQTLRKLIKE